MRYILFILLIVISAPVFAQTYKNQLNITVEGLPRFEDYPVSEKAKSQAKDVDFKSFKGSWSFRTTLREALKGGPIFSGKYTLASAGCGTSCMVTWIINTETGKILGQLFSAYGQDYRMDSALLVTNPLENPSNYKISKDSLDPTQPNMTFYKIENDALITLYAINLYQFFKPID